MCRCRRASSVCCAVGAVAASSSRSDEQRGQLSLASGRVQQAGGREHDDLQEVMEGRCQEAERIGGGPRLGAHPSVGDQIGPGVPAERALAGSDPRGLPLDARGLGLHLRDPPIEPPLDLGTDVQDVPDITPVLAGRIDRPDGGLDRGAAIADRRVPAQPTLLREPQHQRPALGIDRHRTLRSPDRPTRRIDDVQIRPASIVPVHLVQRDRTRRRRRVTAQPRLRPPLRLLHDRADRPEAHPPPCHLPQTRLDATRGGVRLDQQAQHLPLQLRCDRSLHVARLKRLLQRRPTLLRPGVQRLPRHPGRPTQQRHQSVRPAAREQLTHPRHSLCDRATMPTSHRLLPGARGGFGRSARRTRALSCPTLPPTVKSDPLDLNLALRVGASARPSLAALYSAVHQPTGGGRRQLHRTVLRAVMRLPTYSDAAIRAHTSADSFQRGQEYHQRGAVAALVQRGALLEADVWGSDVDPYHVQVTVAADGPVAATCTCPYDWGGWCKHIVAALLAARDQPDQIEERLPLPQLLGGLDRDQLQALLLKVAEYEPRIAAVIESQVALLAAEPSPPPSRSSKIRSLPTRAPVDARALRQQVRALLRSLERMRPSQAYGYVSGVVAAVSDILGRAKQLLEGGDGHGALVVLEAVTEEYLAGWELLDDSDGEASDFFRELGAVWTEALLTAELSAKGRRAWIPKLEAWQAEIDDYGVDGAFGPALAAAEHGWEYPPLQRVLQGEITEQGAWAGDAPDWADELAEARLAILERQERFEEYLHLAEAEGQTGRYAAMLVRLGRGADALVYAREQLVTPQEVLTLATALWERGELERGLECAELGLTREGPKGALASWLRDRAADQGQTERALRAATVAFDAELTLAAYRKVQELAGSDWCTHRPQLLERLRTVRSYAPQGPVEIFIHEGLIADAIAVVNEGATHSLVELVADAAISSHPDWVIQASRQQSEPIMDEGKAQYYHAAARWLGKVRAAYRATGRQQEWQCYLAELLTRHQRKYKLVPLLKALR